MKMLKTLFKNIVFLMKTDLKKNNEELIYQTLLRVEDYCTYELAENQKSQNTLVVLDYYNTIELLLDKPKSFCRFGDGEIEIINGKSIPFQEYDKRLADILKEILCSSYDGMYVGLNYNYFHSTQSLNDINRKFYLVNAKQYRDYLIKHCYKNRVYIAAGFNQLYIAAQGINYDDYYQKVKKLFEGKNIVLFKGSGVLDDLQYDVFELASKKILVDAPSTNAFRCYDELLDKARTFEKTFILCFILGPASKALVYALSKLGFTAYDIGHLAKDYDYYMKKIEKNEANVLNFFRPD